MNINDLKDLCGETADASGWHDDQPDPTLVPQDHNMWVATKIMLVVSELSEAVEEMRSGHSLDHLYHSGEKMKPEGFPVEVADAIIRILDLWWTLEKSGFDMPDLGQLIKGKVDYNGSSRGYKHGKTL